MAHKVAVVIPVYKETLNEFEKISLTQVQKVLGHYQYIFVAPQGKNIPYVTQGSKVYFFPPQFFQNTKTYNYLMMSPNFYKAFLDYEYILIYQLDAFVFQMNWNIFAAWDMIISARFGHPPWEKLKLSIKINFTEYTWATAAFLFARLKLFINFC